MKKLLVLEVLLFIFLLNIQPVLADDTNPTDIESPVIIASDKMYEIGQPVPNWLEGVSVSDNSDITLTIEDILIDDKKVKLDIEGTYPLGYTVMDKSGNLGTKTINVIVSYDITFPSLNGAIDLTFEVNTEEEIDYLENITAIDNKDEDITELVEYDDSEVLLNTVGSYPLTYSVCDSSDNCTSENVLVNVVDTTNPIIENTKDFEFEVHSNLADIDFWDGIIYRDNSEKIKSYLVNIDNIDVNKVGEYDIIYTVTDEVDLVTSVTQKVKIIDTTQPVISGYHDIKIEVGRNNYDYLNGITVEDNYDNLDVSNIIVDANNVIITQPGIYKLHYLTSDSSGNLCCVTVNVEVYDEDVPLISGVKNLGFKVNSTDINLLANITATDATDGDITDKIILFSYVNINIVGEYVIKYIVFDTSGNRQEKLAMVTVYDDEPPIIEGVGDLTIEVNSLNINYLQGITASDNLDGDLTSSIIIDDSNVDLNSLGDYIIIYRVTDSNNNSDEESATVHIVDTTPPVISNYKDINVNHQSTVDLLSTIIATDDFEGDLSGNISIKGYYNLNIPGTYKLKYEISDSSGNYSSVNFTLTVIDNTKTPTNNNTIYYILTIIGVTLVVSGVLGYKNRIKRKH